ncbi:glycosyltransferase family 4 protein [Winogradskyella vidalii]|uniref:glycosyltransferase family 4 protein n=1 Tax=Winogradskyella vidalii TaxID=2615024 RepID=UPI0015CA1191|nr:glycosyltransferase family 4 protein [Winogradskyella vidalii]
MNKKILIVTSEFPPQPGGIGDHAYNLALYFSLSGYKVTVIADQRSENGMEESDFDSALPFKVLRVGLSSPRLSMYLKRLQLLRRCLKSTDLVLASGKFSLWSVGFLGHNGLLRLAVVHGSEVNFSKVLLKASINKALDRFDKIIAVSQFTKSLLPNTIQQKTVVIPNGFNPDKWGIEDDKKVQLKGSPRLITVGQVSERKGQHEVIKLLPNLIQHFPSISYHCIGIPTDQASCELLAESLGVASHLHFYGRLGQSDLQNMLNASDVFVMLSTTTASGDVEGFGIALLEANALGVPTIGASGCGIEDAILPGKSGELVNLEDAEGFVETLSTILNHREHYKLGSKQWAAAHQWDVVIKKYLTEIANVIKL